MKTPKLTVPSVLLIIIFVLSAAGGLIIFYVMETVINPSVDKYIEYRKMFINFGLIMTFVAFILLIFSLFNKTSLRKDKLLNYFLFLLIFAIAWKSYPYWANGLYYVFSVVTSSAYDPKRLYPYTALGLFWSGPILFFLISIWIILPVPVIFWILDMKKNGFVFKDIVIIIVVALICVSFYITPNFMYWLLD